MRHFLEVDDLSVDELRRVLQLARDPAPPKVLEGQGVALIFEKPSGRTRNSMEMATVQLGGHPMYIKPEELGIDSRETAEDVVRVMAGYHAVLAARVFDHDRLERMATTDAMPDIVRISDIGDSNKKLALPMWVESPMSEMRTMSGGLWPLVARCSGLTPLLRLLPAMVLLNWIQTVS